MTMDNSPSEDDALSEECKLDLSQKFEILGKDCEARWNDFMERYSTRHNSSSEVVEMDNIEEYVSNSLCQRDDNSSVLSSVVFPIEYDLKGSPKPSCSKYIRPNNKTPEQDESSRQSNCLKNARPKKIIKEYTSTSETSCSRYTRPKMKTVREDSSTSDSSCSRFTRHKKKTVREDSSTSDSSCSRFTRHKKKTVREDPSSSNSSCSSVSSDTEMTSIVEPYKLPENMNEEEQIIHLKNFIENDLNIKLGAYLVLLWSSIIKRDGHQSQLRRVYIENLKIVRKQVDDRLILWYLEEYVKAPDDEDRLFHVIEKECKSELKHYFAMREHHIYIHDNESSIEEQWELLEKKIPTKDICWYYTIIFGKRTRCKATDSIKRITVVERVDRVCFSNLASICTESSESDDKGRS